MVFTQFSPAVQATFGKLLRFWVSGAFMIVWGFGLNILLNEAFHMNPASAYLWKVMTELVIGFSINRHYVFRAYRGCMKTQLTRYLLANGAFKTLDWLAYTLQVTGFGVPYLLAQTINTLVIAVAKYFLFDRIFSAHPKARQAEG